MNDHFNSKSIYCLISLSNFTNSKEASQLANYQELKFSQGNTVIENVILPFQIQEYRKSKDKGKVLAHVSFWGLAHADMGQYFLEVHYTPFHIVHVFLIYIFITFGNQKS